MATIVSDKQRAMQAIAVQDQAISRRVQALRLGLRQRAEAEVASAEEEKRRVEMRAREGRRGDLLHQLQTCLGVRMVEIRDTDLPDEVVVDGITFTAMNPYGGTALSLYVKTSCEKCEGPVYLGPVSNLLTLGLKLREESVRCFRCTPMEA